MTHNIRTKPTTRLAENAPMTTSGRVVRSITKILRNKRRSRKRSSRRRRRFRNATTGPQPRAQARRRTPLRRSPPHAQGGSGVQESAKQSAKQSAAWKGVLPFVIDLSAQKARTKAKYGRPGSYKVR